MPDNLTPPPEGRFNSIDGASGPEPPELGPTIAPRPQPYVPVATYILVAMNVAMFVVEAFAGGSKNIDVLLSLGASYGPYFHRGEYWRLVTPMFLHIGIPHIFFNMLVLYTLGPILEQMYGYGRYALIYVAAGMSGSYLSMTFSKSIGAGASGAIFGVAGAILMAGYTHRDAMPYPLARIFRRGWFPLFLLGAIVMEFLVDYWAQGIDNWAHFGGLAGGAILATLISPPQEESVWNARSRKTGEAIVIVPIAVVALAMGVMARHYRSSSAVSRLVEQGERLRAARRPDQALEKLQQAERLAPSDDRPHEQLGTLYLAQGKLADAIREFSEALRLNPGSTPAQFGLAVAYQQQGDLAQAQKYFEQALGKNPRDAQAQYDLGDLCLGQKLYQQAIQHYLEALKLAPGFAVAHNNLAWLYATCDDPKFRNPAGALDHAQRAVELTGWRQPEFIDTLAESFYANGKYAEAVKVQERTLALDPNNREYQEHMARYRKAAETRQQSRVKTRSSFSGAR